VRVNMLNINFEDNIDFHDLSTFTNINNIANYELLHTALIQEALVAEEKKLLLNFIESISSKSKVIKSHLFHDEKSRSAGCTNTSLLKIKYERGAR